MSVYLHQEIANEREIDKMALRVSPLRDSDLLLNLRNQKAIELYEISLDGNCEHLRFSSRL
jgi:hypothetical protein